MKKILGLILMLTTLITLSCSNDDSENGNSNSKIVATWGTKWNDGTGIAVHPKFTFLSNGNVKYYTYFEGSNPHLDEIGTWSMNGDIIIMDFPETVDIKFKNRVVFINDSEFEFEEIQDSEYDTWGAESYYKTDDPNLN